MATVVQRILGALLTIVGIAVAAIGLSLANDLGTEGTATFEATPTQGNAIVIGPDVLARLDLAPTVTVTAADKAPVWLGTTIPTDARAVVGSSKHVVARSVDVASWALEVDEAGTTDEKLPREAPIWHDEAAGEGSASLTMGPEPRAMTVVIDRSGTEPVTVSVSWTNQAWFYQALVPGIVAVIIAALGIWVMWRTRSRRTADATPVGAGDDPIDDEPALDGTAPDGTAPDGTAPDGTAPDGATAGEEGASGELVTDEVDDTATDGVDDTATDGEPRTSDGDGPSDEPDHPSDGAVHDEEAATR